MTISIYDKLNKASKIHNNKYGYSLVKYINSRTKIKIKCPIHGIFKQMLASHLTGCGCPKCGILKQNKNHSRKAKQNFKNKAKLIHDNKYDYSLMDYINAKAKIKIICPTHGVFEQTPNNHLTGYGCLKCSHDKLIGLYDKNKLQNDPILANKDSTLYFIQYENLYKIGITTLNVFQRFTKSVKIIYQLNNISLIESHTKEQSILDEYSQFKERPNNWNHGGKTEFLNLTIEQRNQIIIDYFMPV